MQRLICIALLGSATGIGQLRLPPHVKLIPRPAPAQKAPAPQTPAVARCGHIVVYGSRSSVDPKFAIPVPGNPNQPMPVFPGLPPCPENIRPAVK